MVKRITKLFVLSVLVFAIMFVFSGICRAWHTHDTTKQYTLNQLWGMTKARNADYGMTIKNHPWLNEKCIKHFESRTGIELCDMSLLLTQFIVILILLTR